MEELPEVVREIQSPVGALIFLSLLLEKLLSKLQEAASFWLDLNLLLPQPPPPFE